MIVLVVLGIVAALMIPSLIRKQAETANRTKLKKAMTTYEKAFNQMLLDNQLTTNGAILSWADGANVQCENTSSYFRKEDGSGCLFKNSGLWWYIGENEKKIGKVLISTKKIDDNDPNQTLEKVRGYARDKKNMTAFYMTGYIDDKGILRINDKANASEEDKEDVEKLIAFTVNRVMLLEEPKQQSAFEKACTQVDEQHCNYNGNMYTKQETSATEGKFCVNWDWEIDNCVEYVTVSTTEGGDIYYNDIGEVDSSSGDVNSHLASVAELTALQKSNAINISEDGAYNSYYTWFYTSDAEPYNYYSLNYGGGIVGFGMEGEGRAICIGN